jgi:hypothetical protein
VRNRFTIPWLGATLGALASVAIADSALPAAGRAKNEVAKEKLVASGPLTVWQTHCVEILRKACLDISTQPHGFLPENCSSSVAAKIAPGKHPEKLVTLGLVIGGAELYVQAWAGSWKKTRAFCRTEKWDRDFGSGMGPRDLKNGFEYHSFKGPAHVSLYAEQEVTFGPTLISKLESALDRCYCDTPSE